MFLVHNGVVRQAPKAKVRQGIDGSSIVKGMEFAYDAAKVDAEYRSEGRLRDSRPWSSLNYGVWSAA